MTDLRLFRPIAILALAALLAAGCTADDASPGGEQTPRQTAAETGAEAAATTATAGPASAVEPTGEMPAEPVPGSAWERVADAPMELTEVSAAAHDGRLWVAGGLRTDGSATDGVLVYDPAADEWSDGPRLSAGVHHAVLLSTGDHLVLLGGYLGSGFGTPTHQVWVLDDDAGQWRPSAALPEPRAAGAAAWDGERIVFGGGIGPAGVAGDVYALVDDAWAVIGQMTEPREHLAAASDGESRTWFLGGRRGGMDTNTGRVEVVQGSEITLLDRELTPRGGVGGFWIRSAGACLVGGETPGGTLALVECVTPDGDVVELPSLEVPRHGLGLAVLDDGVYAALGGDEPGLFVTAVVERLPLE
jgi:hypothetical protein